MAVTCGGKKGTGIGPHYAISIMMRTQNIGTSRGEIYRTYLGIVVIVKYIGMLGKTANPTLRNVIEWLSFRKLNLAHQKMEAVMLIGRKFIRSP